MTDKIKTRQIICFRHWSRMEAETGRRKRWKACPNTEWEHSSDNKGHNSTEYSVKEVGSDSDVIYNKPISDDKLMHACIRWEETSVLIQIRIGIVWIRQFTCKKVFRCGDSLTDKNGWDCVWRMSRRRVENAYVHWITRPRFQWTYIERPSPPPSRLRLFSTVSRKAWHNDSNYTL